MAEEIERYFSVLNLLFGFVSGHDPEKDEVFNDLPWAETYPELLKLIKGEDIEAGEFGDPGDGIICIWDFGELKLTAYISTRGSWYQAGAYDGETYYAATNVTEGEDSGWRVSHAGHIVCDIAKEGWDTAMKGPSWQEQ